MLSHYHHLVATEEGTMSDDKTCLLTNKIYIF